MELNKQLGQGGAGFQGTGPGTAAEALKSLMGLRVTLLAGAAANTKMALADIREGDNILAAHNNNAGTLTDITGTVTVVNPAAKGTVTVGTIVVGDSVVVAGSTYTVVANTVAVQGRDTTKIAIGDGVPATFATRLAALINRREDNRTAVVRATSAAAVVTITAVSDGTVGNTVPLVETGTSFTISGATLTGGTSTGGIQSSGVTNQVVLYWLKKP